MSRGKNYKLCVGDVIDMLRFFDAFSGIGGFRIGFEAERFECVGWCEVNKFAARLYESYFGDRRNWGDVRLIEVSELPDFEVITAGIPCQPFSVAGKRKGLGDERGGPLWREFFRIVEGKKPEVVVIENVKGLLSSNGGRDFGWVLVQMAELGYGVEWMVLNSKDFGVPQSRERVFVVGYFGGDGRPKVFPIRESEKAYYSPPSSKDGFSTLPDTCSTITAGYYKMRNPGPWIVRWKKDYSHKIESRGSLDDAVVGGSFEDFEIRKLTPLEVFRLQGFPDDVVGKARKIGISDTQLYRMAGNAVTVPIVQSIARKIKRVIFEKEQRL